jgi:hypothetical protein
MDKNDILREISRLEMLVNEGIAKCDSWRDSRDGSHGACLDYNGVYKNNTRIKELKAILGDQNEN